MPPLGIFLPASKYKQNRLVPARQRWQLVHRCHQTVPKQLIFPASLRYDVLVVDATSLLTGVVAADNRRCANIPGRNTSSTFADWISYLSEICNPELTLACFDTPRAARTGASHRQILEPKYLQRRGRKANGISAAGSAEHHSKDHLPHRKQAYTALYPFLARLKSVGAVGVVARDGWEADDCVGAACALIQRSHPGLNIAVASGDGDMQQLLTPRVTWLRLLPAPTLEHPLGVEVVSAQAFQERHGFPPGAYPDWLAFVGKKDSGLGGVGTGASTAAKLLKRYGSIEGIDSAAANGELGGWSPAVQRLFGRGADAQGKRVQLRRNRQVLSINCSPAVLGVREATQIESHACRVAGKKLSTEAGGGAGSGRTCDTSQTLGDDKYVMHQGTAPSRCAGVPLGSDAPGPAGLERQAGHRETQLAWAHPWHATRWCRIKGHVSWLVRELQGHGMGAVAHTTSRSGVAVDVLVHAGQESLGVGVAPVAVVVAGMHDFPKDRTNAVEGCQPDNRTTGVRELVGSLDESRALVRQLNGAMQQHVRLLAKDGLAVLCVPTWRLQCGHVEKR